MKRAMFLALGVVFGFTLSRSGAADFGFIQGMFLLTNLQLYGILAAGVGFTAPGLWLLQRYGRTATGEPIRFTVKSSHPGNLVGGAMFGVGWAMTGMCPGPIFVNLGEGKLYAVPALAGALFGAWLFGATRPRVERSMRLSALPPEPSPAA